jgi:predicted ribosomally synthesized peptide with SipW-like signal peptide
MTDDNSFTVSRRKVLGGVGAIGLASAGAGLGTTAYFNDTESFSGNTLEAGSLDLFVHVDYSEDQGSYAQYSTPPGTFIDGNVVGGGDGEPLRIEVSDLKPGDSGEGEFCFSIVDNPAYLWMCGGLTQNAQNGTTEPEAETLDELYGSTPANGQLADAMMVTLSYCTTEEADGETTTVIGDEIVSGSLAEVMAMLAAGVPLSGDGDGDAPLADRPVFEGVEQPFIDEEVNAAETCVCFEWEVPTDVGNEIQTDSVMFDLEFYAEQARHGDGTNNPCIDASYSADYVNPDGITQPIPDGVARVDVAYGEANVVYGITFDEPDGSQYSLADPNFANANFSMPFDVEDDGGYDFQVAWNAEGNDAFRYSGVSSVPEWEKDDGTGWSALPSGFTAVKSGSQAIISVPRSLLETGGATYGFGFSASAGGEQPSVSIPTGGPYSSNANWTSSENSQEETVQ